MSAQQTQIGVIGAGAMGSGIAQVAALKGYPVVVYDTNEVQLQKASVHFTNTIHKLIEKGKIPASTGEQALRSLTFTGEMASMAKAAIVIEAVIENLEVKQSIFMALENIVSPGCILASNTSSLSITSIGGRCTHPERVIGLHFFNPAPLMPLVEIIPGFSTEGQIISKASQLMLDWGKVIVIAKDTPGFIVNRVARSFYGEALRIYEEGIASFDTIDWAMKHFGQFKMGPFELMDLIGNDINYTVTETVWKQMYFDARYKPSLTQKRMVEANRLGRKTGKGYYDYSPEGIRVVANDKDGLTKDEALGQNIFMRVMVMLINEALDNVYLQTATASDIDLAMVKGVNYPKGLLAWGEEMGWKMVFNTLNDLFELYGEDRYRPSVLLKKKLQ